MSKPDPNTTAFAVFKDGKQVSKAHSTKLAAVVEGMQVGAYVAVAGAPILAHGYEIKEAADGKA